MKLCEVRPLVILSSLLSVWVSKGDRSAIRQPRIAHGKGREGDVDVPGQSARGQDRLRRGGHQRDQPRHRETLCRARRQGGRSEEHTYELQSLMRTSDAVFCLKKKKK